MYIVSFPLFVGDVDVTSVFLFLPVKDLDGVSSLPSAVLTLKTSLLCLTATSSYVLDSFGDKDGGCGLEDSLGHEELLPELIPRRFAPKNLLSTT